jgi:hypothetical protein
MMIKQILFIIWLLKKRDYIQAVRGFLRFVVCFRLLSSFSAKLLYSNFSSKAPVRERVDGGYLRASSVNMAIYLSDNSPIRNAKRLNDWSIVVSGVLFINRILSSNCKK